MTPTSLRRGIPVLRIFDVARAREFYVDYLGFTVDWEHRFGDDFPLYMQVSRDELVLHLSEHSGDGTPGTVVYVAAAGVQEWHAELAAKEYRYLRPGIDEGPTGGACLQCSTRSATGSRSRSATNPTATPW